jgi:hypothetical protein
MDSGERFSCEQNWRAVGFPRNPSHFFLPRLLSPLERASEAAGAPTGQRSGVVARLLVGGRRAVVEQSRCDALSREPELVNPRLGTGEPRVPFLDSDEVGSDGGRPR